MNLRKTLTLWQPPGETIEAIATVLSSHWSAARSQPGLFWAKTSWLRRQVHGTVRRIAPHAAEHPADSASVAGVTT